MLGPISSVDAGRRRSNCTPEAYASSALALSDCNALFASCSCSPARSNDSLVRPHWMLTPHVAAPPEKPPSENGRSCDDPFWVRCSRSRAGRSFVMSRRSWPNGPALQGPSSFSVPTPTVTSWGDGGRAGFVPDVWSEVGAGRTCRASLALDCPGFVARPIVPIDCGEEMQEPRSRLSGALVVVVMPDIA